MLREMHFSPDHPGSVTLLFPSPVLILTPAHGRPSWCPDGSHYLFPEQLEKVPGSISETIPHLSLLRMTSFKQVFLFFHCILQYNLHLKQSTT